MLHWFDPIFPVNLIYNFINCFLSIFIISIFATKYKINKNILFILIISLIFPLTLNGPLMNWEQLPDQSKYLRDTIRIRDFEFGLLDGRQAIFFSSFIFAITPFPYIESFNDIGLINRLFFSLIIIFLIHKKVKKMLIFYLILSPSVILYSSTALKEILVIIFTILAFFAIVERKNLIFIITMSALFILKVQNAILILPFFLLFKYSFDFKFTYKYILSIILIFLILILYTTSSDLLLGLINKYRRGFYDEETGSSFGFVVLNNFYEVIRYVPSAYIKFLISPFPNIVSPVKSLFFIDSVILLILLITNFIQLKKISVPIFIFWSLFFLAFLSMYSLTIINDGTISRYKLSFFIPFLLITHYLNQNKKKQSNEK